MRFKLVIPHYRMVERLELYLPELLAELGGIKSEVRVQVVDDGSDQAVQLKVQALCQKLGEQDDSLLDPILQPDNRGKGYAIRHGWKQHDDCNMLAFVDADGSIPAISCAQFLEESAKFPRHVSCAIRPLSSHSTRSRKRRWVSDSFIWLVDRWLKLGLQDPQCGFKVLPVEAYERIEEKLEIDRFAFDCELMAWLRRMEVPVREEELPWEESPVSTVGVVKDGFQMLLDIWNLKNRL